MYLGSMSYGNSHLELLSEISGYNYQEILYCAYLVSDRYERSLNSSLQSIRNYFKNKIDINNVYFQNKIFLENKSNILRPKYRIIEPQKEDEIIFLKKTLNLDRSYSMKDFNLPENINDLFLTRQYSIKDIDISPLFEPEILGSGTYSTVYKVKYDGIIKAYKVMVCEDSSEGILYSDLRELSFLKTISNTNIVDMNYVKIDNNSCISIVLELLETDLHNLIREGNLDTRLIKRYSLQLVNSVKYLKDLGILHRDIKPQNILVKGEDIKLADFGLSYPYVNTIYKRSKFLSVYTLHYRPIEILLQESEYSFEADVWATGVTIAEMVKGYFLFPGGMQSIQHHIGGPVIYQENIENQITLILKFLGTQKVINSLPYNNNIKVYTLYKPIINYKEFFNTNDNLLIDLLKGMINTEDTRLTIEECINHPWFMN